VAAERVEAKKGKGGRIITPGRNERGDAEKRPAVRIKERSRTAAGREGG